MLEDDHTKADLTSRERALCDYAVKLSVDERNVGEADLGPLREVGLTDREIHDAVQGLFIGLALNVAAQAGDLAESLLKRGARVKDSGTIFPGHGGMLDRLDSFLPTLPLYAAILAIFGS